MPSNFSCVRILSHIRLLNGLKSPFLTSLIIPFGLIFNLTILMQFEMHFDSVHEKMLIFKAKHYLETERLT